MDEVESLLREWAELAVLAERGRGKRRERRKKPGGPRTDIGALRQLNPDGFKSQVRATVKSKKGDMDNAASTLGVAKRTLYHYLEDEPGLQNVKTATDIELGASEEEAKKKRQDR